MYGAIEVHNPADSAPWTRAMDLYPLYANFDYLPLGCLFGVRNWAGWEPIAAQRGLPADVSESIRAEFEAGARSDEAIGQETWVSWAELKTLDMTEGVRLESRTLTRLDALGPGTGWEHVFAVMQALAGRFGDDGVRIVAWFD